MTDFDLIMNQTVFLLVRINLFHNQTDGSNGIPLGSYSKLSPRSCSFQFEGRKKSISLYVEVMKFFSLAIIFVHKELLGFLNIEYMCWVLAEEPPGEKPPV